MNDERLIPLLAEYARTRDVAVRDRLFESYLPLARTVAAKFVGRGVAREDLEQVAGMALLKALAAQPGQVRSREELLALLPAAGDDAHAVEVAIGRLRTA